MTLCPTILGQTSCWVLWSPRVHGSSVLTRGRSHTFSGPLLEQVGRDRLPGNTSITLGTVITVGEMISSMNPAWIRIGLKWPWIACLCMSVYMYLYLYGLFSHLERQFKLPTLTRKLPVISRSSFYHGPDISRAMVIWPPFWNVTDLCLTEQTRTNMFQPGRRLGTAVGDEWHVLKALWNRKDI